MSIKNNKHKIKCIILCINFLYFIGVLIKESKIIIYIKFIIYYIKSHKEFINTEKYLELCNNNTFTILDKFEKSQNPKISIISPVFNRQRYILRFIKSIQNQDFQDIEIIFINDCSEDKSIEIIQEYQNIDKRIKLINNKQNKGTFITRNLGVLYAKGKYIILPDPDDIISKHILSVCYKYAEKYDYDIIKFNVYLGNGILVFNELYRSLVNKKVYFPNLSTYIYYGKDNELLIIDYYLCNKFIKKEIFIYAINYLSKNYMNKYIIFSEDSMMNYIIFRIARSFYYLNKIGYYYVRNNLSITQNLFHKSAIRTDMIFIYLKLVFEYSKNNKYEKDMSNFLFTNFNSRFNIPWRISTFNHDIKFYLDIINDYLNCKFIKDALNKDYLYLLKNLLLNKIYFRND